MVYTILTQIVIKTAVAFPQQALWTVFAILKSSSKDRASRGMQCQQKILVESFSFLKISFVNECY